MQKNFKELLEIFKRFETECKDIRIILYKPKPLEGRIELWCFEPRPTIPTEYADIIEIKVFQNDYFRRKRNYYF